jgi:hemoglobin
VSALRSPGRTVARAASIKRNADSSIQGACSMRTFVLTAMTTLTLTSLAGAAFAQPAMQKSLYERLGGQPAIIAVVDDFVGNVAKDKRINRYFAKADVPRLKARLVEQICRGTGGPCFYLGRDMKSVHAGMGIRAADFNALVGDLGKTLKKFKVPKKEQGELVAILAPMKRDIVERR